MKQYNRFRKYLGYVGLLLLSGILLVQCYILHHAQRNTEERFIQNFCTTFFIFEDRFSLLTDPPDEITSEDLDICYNAIFESETFFSMACPVSAHLLFTERPFADDFDSNALGGLRQQIGYLSLKLSGGNPLSQDDVVWIQQVRQELEILEESVHAEPGVLRETIFQEKVFVQTFNDFFSEVVKP